MTSLRDRMAVLGGLVLAWSSSCAVFPDAAILPSSSTLGGVGGEATSNPAAGTGGDGSSMTPGGAAGDGGGVGAPIGASAGTSLGGAAAQGGAPIQGGAGGQTEPACESAVDEVTSVSLDTWIEAADEKAAHGSEALLSVVGGGDERRALLQWKLPTIPEGAELLEAWVELNLEQNADTMRAERRLAVQRLLHPISESKTTWVQFLNGSSGEWDNKGGDYAGPAGEGRVPAGTTSGVVRLDAAPALAPIFASGADVPLIIREVGSTPLSPADLSFASREGGSSLAPKLHLRYCPP